MGMVLGVTTLSDENIAKVLADPPLIWKVLAPEDPDPYRTARGLPPAPALPQPASPGLLGRLFGKKPVPAAPAVDAELGLGEGEGEHTYLDKSWHGIHYLLTGSDWAGEPPLNFLVSGGRAVEIDDEDARVLDSRKVQELNEALAGIDEAYLRRRFNPAEMMRLNIYPTIWDRDPVKDDTFGYCLEYFQILQAYIAKAAERRLGIVVSLS